MVKKPLLNVSAHLTQFVKSPESSVNPALAQQLKADAQKWMAEALKEKGLDPESLIFDVNLRDVIPLDSGHCSVVVSVRPKGFVHIPIKGKIPDDGFVTLVTRSLVDDVVVWSNKYVDLLIQELLAPTRWARKS